jgi:hypothetical protein
MQARDGRVYFSWVKGHATHLWNSRADELALKGSMRHHSTSTGRWASSTTRPTRPSALLTAAACRWWAPPAAARAGALYMRSRVGRAVGALRVLLPLMRLGMAGAV